MRVQNEGTGKSSWWVLNPDAKPGKSTRRRANTMEGGRCEKNRRGRVKKKIDHNMRNGLDTTPSPSSSLSESLDLYPDSPHGHAIHPAYSQLSPPDYRPRASSNASSSGRLSPIPAMESDMHDSQVPPMSPGMGGWGGEYWPHHAHPHHAHERYADQLIDSMGEGLKLGPADSWARPPNPPDCMKLSPHGPPGQHINGFLPHHHHHPQAFSHFEDFHRFGHHPPHGPPFPHTPTAHPPAAHQEKMTTPNRPHLHNSYSLTNLQAMSPAHSVHSLSPTQPLGEGHYPGPGGEAHQPNFPSPATSQPPHTAHHSGRSSHAPTGTEPNMLRAALTHREQQQQQQQQQQQSHSGSPGSSDGGGGSGPGASGGPGHMPADFPDFDTPIQGGLDCNVEEVIKHELQVEGNLDFSFPQAHHHHHHHHHGHHPHPHAHAHAHAHAVPHAHPDGPQINPPPGMSYPCSTITAGNHWVR